MGKVYQGKGNQIESLDEVDEEAAVARYFTQISRNFLLRHQLIQKLWAWQEDERVGIIFIRSLLINCVIKFYCWTAYRNILMESCSTAYVPKWRLKPFECRQTWANPKK